MGAGATRKVLAELARLDAAAQSAGCALACKHQTADEFHRALIVNYLRLHPRRNPFAYVLALGAIAAILTFI